MTKIRVSSLVRDLGITQYLKDLLEQYGLTTVRKLANCEGTTLRQIKGLGADKIRILAEELDQHQIPHRLRE
ncbi:MAG TPA: hypothetical protein VEA92_01135 [Candidatus Paceibacterota bacterium]|nr:hypothetical protein [Candidatus Paceibacterota bacterium]